MWFANTRTAVVALAAAFLPALSTNADESLFIYPAAGQSQETIEFDRYQCYLWAVDQSGTDPNTLAPPSNQPKIFKNPEKGQTARGTLVGTLAGAALGSLIDGHGKDSAALPGAVIGASIGTLVGAEKEHQGANQARQAAHAEARQRSQDESHYHYRLASYQRAFRACMEGRSYVVK